MKWFTDFFGKKKAPIETTDTEWNDELFNLCWDREALLVEIDAAKRHKKKSSHLIEALARNTRRRLELDMAHNGKASEA